MYRLVLLSALLACAAGVPLNKTKPRLDGRIVGGYRTDFFRHRYQVSLLLWGSYRCSGSIISENWVLTLAYCVVGYKSRDFVVMSGSNNPNSGGTIQGVKSIIVHERFNSGTWAYDVALVQVSPAFTFSYGEYPINLECNPVPVGTDVVVSGWGYSPQEGDYSTTLREVNLQIISDSECNSTYGGWGGINDSMICAGNSHWGTGACSGDWGGPLVYRHHWYHNNKLIGIYNFGIACGDPKFPDIYTKVSAVCEWIVVKTGLYKNFAHIWWNNNLDHPDNATDIKSNQST